MTNKEKEELSKLRTLWATQRASMKQMTRCMELQRKNNAEQRRKNGMVNE